MRNRLAQHAAALAAAVASEAQSQAPPSAPGNQVTMVPVNVQYAPYAPQPQQPQPQYPYAQHSQYTNFNHMPHSDAPSAPMPATLAPQPHHAASPPVLHAPGAYAAPSHAAGSSSFSSSNGDWLCGVCEHRNEARYRSCDSCDTPKAKALEALHAAPQKLPPAMHTQAATLNASLYAPPAPGHAIAEPGQDHGRGAPPPPTFETPHYFAATAPPRYSAAPPPQYELPAYDVPAVSNAPPMLSSAPAPWGGAPQLFAPGSDTPASASAPPPPAYQF